MNSVYNPTKKLLEKSNNAKINFLRKNITETPPLKMVGFSIGRGFFPVDYIYKNKTRKNISTRIERLC